MKITRQVTADKLSDYLHGRVTQADLVEWSPREVGATWTSAARGRRPRTGAFESIDSTREKLGQPSDLHLLQKTFDRMK